MENNASDALFATPAVQRRDYGMTFQLHAPRVDSTDSTADPTSPGAAAAAAYVCLPERLDDNMGRLRVTEWKQVKIPTGRWKKLLARPGASVLTETLQTGVTQTSVGIHDPHGTLVFSAICDEVPHEWQQHATVEVFVRHGAEAFYVLVYDVASQTWSFRPHAVLAWNHGHRDGDEVRYDVQSNHSSSGQRVGLSIPDIVYRCTWLAPNTDPTRKRLAFSRRDGFESWTTDAARYERLWRDGRRSGVSRCVNLRTGRTLSETSFCDDLRSGPFAVYYRNGNVHKRGFYVRDVLHGAIERFLPDGSKDTSRDQEVYEFGKRVDVTAATAQAAAAAATWTGVATAVPRTPEVRVMPKDAKMRYRAVRLSPIPRPRGNAAAVSVAPAATAAAGDLAVFH